MRLDGKAALVTGASAGIGRATALALARAGADVAINYLTYPEAAEELAGQIRGLNRRALLWRVDVSDQAAVEAMVDRIAAELGRLDLLVASAVYSDREPFCTANMAGFRRTLDVTMWGAFHVLRAAANQMVKQGYGGSAVLLTSPQAHIAIPGSMAYNMAKAAVELMARTAALELAPHGIRINLVCPGWTDTPGERKYFSEEALRHSSAALPCGRLAHPDEIARGILFLLDPESTYITGSTLAIDGGSQLPWWSKRLRGEL